MPEKHDYVQWTKRTVEAELSLNEKLVLQLNEDRTTGTSPKDLKEYTGWYLNSTGTMSIEISLENDQLSMCFQGLAAEKYELKHFANDTFTWLASQNELAARGRFTNYSANYYKIKFRSTEEGTIDGLIWTNVPGIPEGEEYLKK
jgi:hypothetical protein